VSTALLLTTLRSPELDFSTKWISTTNWDNDQSAPSTLWNDANSDPVSDVMTQINFVLAGVNRASVELIAITTDEVMRQLSIHPDMHGTAGSLGLVSGPATPDAVTTRLNLDRIVTAGAFHTTSLPKAATATYASIVNNHFLVLAVSRAQASMQGPTAGVSHLWKPARVWSYAAPGGQGIDAGTMIVETELKIAHTQVAASMGCIRSDVIA